MSNYKVLIGNESHVKGMHIIEEQSFITPWSYKSLYDDVVNNSIAIYLVMLDGKEVIGYLGFWMIIDQAHITTLAIKNTYRRKHLALDLFSKMIELVKGKGIEAITLEVRENNIPALTLYEKLGFIKEGIRKNYYKDTNENALIMWKNL